MAAGTDQLPFAPEPRLLDASKRQESVGVARLFAIAQDRPATSRISIQPRSWSLAMTSGASPGIVADTSCMSTPSWAKIGGTALKRTPPRSVRMRQMLERLQWLNCSNVPSMRNPPSISAWSAHAIASSYQWRQVQGARRASNAGASADATIDSVRSRQSIGAISREPPRLRGW